MVRNNRISIVTHTDLDGVASAAIYLRLAGINPEDPSVLIVFTEPYKLHKALQSMQADKIVIADLGPNPDTFNVIIEELKERVKAGAKVEWYDHHRWQEVWLQKLRDIGAHVYVDTSTCAAGVVAKYAPKELEVDPDEFSLRLASITCAADLWVWNEPLAGKLYRVVSRYKGRKGDKWRRIIVKGFYDGAFWWPELDEALNEYIRLELSNFNRVLAGTVTVRVDGCTIIGALKPSGPPSTSFVASSLLSRFNADIAVIVRKRGTGLSLRSRRFNVREIALAMGGGGHTRAAGAPLKMPVHYKVLSLITPKIKLRYALKRVVQAVRSIGGCEKLAIT